MLVAAFTKRLTNYEQQLWEYEMLPPRSNAFNSVEMVHLVKCLLCWQEITSQSFQWPDSQGEPCNKCLNSWNTEQRDDSAFVHHVRWSIKEESRHLLKSTACPETRCGVKETGRLGGSTAGLKASRCWSAVCSGLQHANRAVSLGAIWLRDAQAPASPRAKMIFLALGNPSFICRFVAVVRLGFYCEDAKHGRQGEAESGPEITWQLLYRETGRRCFSTGISNPADGGCYNSFHVLQAFSCPSLNRL